MKSAVKSAVFGAAAAVLAAGCFDVPPFAPAGAVAFEERGTGGVVTGTAGTLPFTLHFAEGNGFHFPDQLLVGETDVFGHHAAAGCFEEDEVGIIIDPTPRLSANSGANIVRNVLEPVLRGPAAVQVKLDWATSFPCNQNRAPNGTSTYTVFPDGRIVRFDRFSDSSMSPISPSLCSCGDTAQLFDISTYWTLTRTGSLGLFTRATDEVQELPIDGQAISNQSAACIDRGAQQISFGWAEGPGQHVIRGREPLVGFGRELEIGATTLTAFEYTDGSALFIGASGCDDGMKRAIGHADPDPLKVGDTLVMPSPRDGIYGGATASGEAGLVVPASGSVEVEGPLGTSFAVWVRFAGGTDAVRATLESKSGAWYMPQRVDDRSWILWFREGLSQGQKIKIESR